MLRHSSKLWWKARRRSHDGPALRQGDRSASHGDARHPDQDEQHAEPAQNGVWGSPAAVPGRNPSRGGE
ncbi:hypothetical protein [Streptomyces sp. NPDC088789]|uniref:hypothetical protein n=1 Tax=Streptomyces sp. NPDC088789 TaxID=3365899 RepID=UPI0037F42B6F